MPQKARKTILLTTSGVLLFSFLAFAFWYLRVPDSIHYFTIAPSHFLDVEDTNVHYIEEEDDGSQPPLLLVHGYASSTYTWNRLWPLLAPHYHLVAIDLPGFGLSEKNTKLSYTLDTQTKRLQTFIQKKFDKPVYVVSWSMGSLFSLWIAKDHPELFQKIVTLAPALNPDVVFGPYQIAEWTAPLLAPWFITPQFIKLTFPRVFAKRPPDEDVFALQAYYPFHKNPAAYITLISHIKILADPRIPSELKGLQVPFRILIAEKDRIVKVKHYDKFFEVYPNADRIYHPTSGHGMMIDEPEWVKEKTLDFFTSKP